MSGSPLWTPSPQRVARANLSRFLAGHANYAALYRWSIEQPEEFWPAVWRFCGVKASRMWDSVREPAEGVRQYRWFPGAALNFAENLLRYQDEEPAIIAWNESGGRRTLTNKQLYDSVSQAAQALRASGVREGDRVAGYLPNIPEAVIAMLATASLGAIWSSCSPDFGVQGVLDRFAQIEPKVLFAASSCTYNGKRIDTLARTREIAAGLPSLRVTVLLHEYGGIPRSLRWGDFLAFSRPKKIEFAQLPFDHPLYILYSSGTTGLPKCMVHGAGGTLLQHLKEHVLHTDLHPGDRIFYHTTCGWMMWNWLVSALASGACLVLYDGSPLHPQKDVLWRMAAEERVSVFGTSAKYLALIQKERLRPCGSHDLTALRTVLSTGSPLPSENFDYVYEAIKSDVCLSSISGGTDIVSCFALGNPIGPVWRGEIQTRGLGMKVEVFDDEGRSVVGQTGELVCTAPFPSMPLRFWNDPDESKYRSAYFDRYPGVWKHGDWASITNHDGVIITGRSDTTLNPGGVRIGTAEVYRQVEQIDEVLESLAVGREFDGDVRIVLFVKLRDGVVLTPELDRRIRQQIRDNASPHHVPKRIVQVPDLPRTVSGKITEAVVRDILQGRPVRNANALANPEVLEYFRLLHATEADVG